MSKQDGGPAFPGNEDWMHSGLSLRDYFAGKALREVDVFAYDGDGARDFFADVARRAYTLADAMLAERDKP